jgi:glutaredoxin
LNAEGVEFELNDVEQSAELAAEAEAIAGRKNIPVIQFADGLVLVEPSDDELRAALGERGLI